MTAVLLDFYGTVAAAVSWLRTPDDVLRHRGYALPDGIRETLLRETTEGLDHHEFSVTRERYLDWDRSRVSMLVAACGVPDHEAPEVVEEVWAARKPAELVVYEEVPGVLSELRAAGVTIGLCSNWDWDLETELVDLGLAGAFDLVITSARAGARKPHERIYRYALEQLGTDPERVLFVGDTLIADIQGPMRAGMRAAYLHRAGARGWPGWSGFDQAPAQLPSLPAGVPLIGDLTGVLPLLDLPPKPASAQHR